MSELDFTTSHPSVKLYLDYVANTESPRLFHIWSFLSGISAAMGRRCWLPMGTGEIFPNMYVILTGPPAVRKSTAFRIMCRLLRNYTNVKFAPDDTGGQRQGLIAAMMNCANSDDEDENEIVRRMASLAEQKKNGGSGETTFAELGNPLDILGDLRLDTRDPRTMFIAASELNSILGEGNTALLTFLIKMWDGDAYRYQLKATTHELKDALLGLIGATTPSQLALALPTEAVGQGFTSRAIFVFADQKHARKIARPSLNMDLEHELSGIFSRVANDFEGAFKETGAAARKLDELYERGIVVADPRFVHYSERRHDQLQKLCMSLAASRGSQTIEEIDVTFGDQLLLFTERFMPDALGEYGMSKLSAAKQKLLEFLKTADGPIPVKVLHGFMHRDMSQLEFKQTLVDLHNAGKLSLSAVPGLGQCVIPIADTPARQARKDTRQIDNLLAKSV